MTIVRIVFPLTPNRRARSLKLRSVVQRRRMIFSFVSRFTTQQFRLDRGQGVQRAWRQGHQNVNFTPEAT